MWRSRMRGRWYRIALALCAALSSGCVYWQTPRLDPSGERLFTEPVVSPCPAYRCEPGRPLADDPLAVLLAPRRTVAPVGSEVILVAGVRAGDGYLRTNERLEWSIAPGSVGQFVDVQRNDWTDLLLGDFNRPRKISNTFAIGSTSREYVRLDRGTPTPSDDVCVLRGQGWITVTSPIEGTSHVVVYAPGVVPWDGRLREATIYWIDAQFGFPPPSISPAGSRHVLTTTVLRQSNQAPHVGWVVRYEIVGGPPAGFLPDGAPAVEVLTNAAGQGCAEIIQKEPAPGTNNIAIRVIRPDGPAGERFVVGNGSTLKTWTAAAVTVHKRGPAVASVGATVTYHLEVSNPGDLPAADVVLSDEVPDSFTYLTSTPPAELVGKRLQWRLGPLGPGQKQAVELNFRAIQPGSVANCAEVTAAGGLRGSDCVTTTVMAPAIELQVNGPPEVAVGNTVTFEIAITNHSQVTASGLLLKDRYAPGLEHATVRTNPIEHPLADLAPGETKRIGLTFRVVQPGRLGHSVEILGPAGVLASSEGFVTGVAGAGGPSVPSPSPAPPAVELPRLSVKESGPPQGTVGQLVDFSLVVVNRGSQPATNVKVVEHADAGLQAVQASRGAKLQNGNLVWTFSELPAGRSLELGIQFRCEKPAARLGDRVLVTSQEGAREETEAFIEVSQPPQPAPETAPAGLSVTVVGLGNQVAAGHELTYDIRVKNKGLMPYRQVMLTATVPAAMALVPLQTSGPSPLTYTYENNQVRFSPAAAIGPGETLTCHIRVRAKQPGRFHFDVHVSSLDLPQPLQAEEITEVFQPQNR